MKRGMLTGYRSQLLAGTALIFAASAATPGLAADAASAAGEIETVTVTSSRIQLEGYEAPTPVTVVDLDSLQRDARPDIGDVLRNLPAFGASSSPNNSARASLVSDGSAGLNLVSLRNLGQLRTLVLFNGQRVVSSNLALGGTDLSTIPSTLVERIDVVTGGASASWGSDAVAGVVNLILNTKLEGFRTNLEYGNNFKGEHGKYRAEVTYGQGFNDDRGHFVVSGVYGKSPQTFFSNKIEGFDNQRLVNNPAYTPTNSEPLLIRANKVGLAQATPGGIITGGPLKGIYFTGNGTPAVFNYGNVSGGYYTNGGTPNYGQSQSDIGVISFPQENYTLFAHVGYDITDNIRASLQLNHGHYASLVNTWSAVYYGSQTIQVDNAFLPESVRQQMIAAGVTSVPFGTTLTQDLVNGGGSVRGQAKSLGVGVQQVDRSLYRGVASLDGTMTWFDNRWSWNAYFQHGVVNAWYDGINNQTNSRVRDALDAVRVTAANVGSSGLPIGTIVCRTTLTSPTNGCVPLDAFGTGKDTSAAAAYINGVARAGGNFSNQILRQDVVAASANGALPFDIGAGPFSTAFGVEYRRESGYARVSPESQATTFYAGNPKNFSGVYSDKEAFLEVVTPLLRDQGVKSLEVQVAGRYTDYSVSGGVTTYKIGASSELNDDIRVRGTFSHDIRAPWLFEWFNTGAPITGSAVDPRTGQGVSILGVTQGNKNLKPEIANTLTAGIVLAPEEILPGFNISFDWYRIKIKDVIVTANSQTTLAQCAAGVQVFCNNLEFRGPNGALSAIYTQPVNAALQETSGFDIQADYRVPFGAGAINVHNVTNYMIEDVQTAFGLTYDAAGAIGQGTRTSVPKLKSTLSVTYAQDNWDLTAQGRLIGSARINNAWGPKDIDDNTIPAVGYLDLRASLKFYDYFQVYAALDNVLGKAPPVVPRSAGNGSGYEPPFRDTIHDAFGRVIRAGLRVKM